ncbi:MAG: restriction endonuclease [Oceanicaulis sp.]
MIPDYQSLMRPVLELSAKGEVKVSEAVDRLAEDLSLTDAERGQMLRSGRQTVFANRVHWAKAYLKQAGLVRPTRRGYFVITNQGREVLSRPGVELNRAYLERFDAFQDFISRTGKGADAAASERRSGEPVAQEDEDTPDEQLFAALARINDALALELLDRLRAATPAFFETVIVELLLAMGYGGGDKQAGRTLGRSGDGGVDGVIDQDPLGVDQVYVQAKLYREGNVIGSGAIRDFFGALNLRRAQKGIFVTASTFSSSAVETANQLGSRIVLIDGADLARLMIRYGVGCRVERRLELMKLDEDFFTESE